MFASSLHTHSRGDDISIKQGQATLAYLLRKEDTHGRRPDDMAKPNFSRAIHIHGLGSIGKLVAHALAANTNPPPITLLMHKESLLRDWVTNGEKLEVRRNNIVEPRVGFNVERGFESNPLSRIEPSRYGTISNLILAVKGVQAAVAALSALRHRLTPESTILFLQNGMGIIDEVTEQVFPDKDTRPCYLLGVVTHGVLPEAQFRVRHAGVGTIAIGLPFGVPFETSIAAFEKLHYMAPSTRYMLRTLTRTPILGAIGLHPIDLLQVQLEKIAVNAIINPLTAIYECKNSALLDNLAVLRLTFMMLAEISLVIRSLPELKGIPNVEERFSAEKLRKRVIGIALSTGENESSMLQDVRIGNATEIETITGYIIRRGEELGIRCVINYAILQIIKAKITMVRQRFHGFVPVEKLSTR